jgi:hypothetical protein
MFSVTVTVRGIEEDASCDMQELLSDQYNQSSLGEDTVPEPEEFLLPFTQEPEVEDSVFRLMDMEVCEQEVNEVANGTSQEMLDGNTLLDGQRRLPPTIPACQMAHSDLAEILHPHRKNGIGYLPFDGDELLRKRLDMMRMLLWAYVDPKNPRTWTKASDHAAQAYEKSGHTARLLRKWTRSFVEDREDLPINLYGSWNVSLLDKGTLAEDIHLHLQSIGKYVRAQDVVDYLAQSEVQQRQGLKNTISLATAQRWMHMMDFRWTKSPSGQYVDGHEREDVVTYRQTKFLPMIAELAIHMRTWKDGLEEANDEPRPHTQRVVLWFHDESTFYANDRRKVYWVHKDETAKPHPKGEGASLMVADFVSADYGWLRSPCGQESAQILFRAGKTRDGYFTNDAILGHAELAMGILDRHFPNDRHILMFDNATTHLKRADDALSARHMPKFQTKAGGIPFGVPRTKIGSDGKPVYGANGKVLIEKIRMADGQLPDGTTQCFYFPEGHGHAGAFKGMAEILKERGFTGAHKLRAECPGFKCNLDTDHCCCRRLLYKQPDFADIKSNLEIACERRGYKVLFLPKFHCELSFLEQCWGYGKRVYRQFPPSSSEAILKQNVINALNAVPLITMRK